jgi:transcriptional regulator with GAF, ATPase, and Fis domain
MEIEWNVPEERAGVSRERAPGGKRMSADRPPGSLEMVWEVADISSQEAETDSVKKPPHDEQTSGRVTVSMDMKSAYSKKVRDLFRIIDKNRAASEDPTILCEMCLEKVMASLEAERGFILLYDDSTDNMEVYAASNIDPNRLLVSEPVSHSILDTIMKERKSRLLSDALTDPHFGNLTSVVISGLRSILCVPILASGGLLGILYVDNRLKKGAFSRTHLEYLDEFAGEISRRITQYFPQVQPKFGK